MLRGTDPAHKLAVNWQAGEVKLERERKREGAEMREGRRRRRRRAGCVHAVEKMRTREKRAGSQTQAAPQTHTHTHPLLSLQSGLGKQEAACVSNRSNVCARVCVCIEFNAALESGRDVSH